MPILKINRRATLIDIIKGIPSGDIQDFIYNSCPKNRLEELVYHAYNEQLKGAQVFIEVKYVSKYSSREKRLEIVTVKDGVLSIYKVSSPERFDKDAIELKRIVDEVNEKNPTDISIRGILKMKSPSDIDRVKEMLKNMELVIDVE